MVLFIAALGLLLVLDVLLGVFFRRRAPAPASADPPR
jgi:hypothetical protein